MNKKLLQIWFQKNLASSIQKYDKEQIIVPSKQICMTEGWFKWSEIDWSVSKKIDKTSKKSINLFFPKLSQIAFLQFYHNWLKSIMKDISYLFSFTCLFTNIYAVTHKIALICLKNASSESISTNFVYCWRWRYCTHQLLWTRRASEEFLSQILFIVSNRRISTLIRTFVRIETYFWLETESEANHKH